MLVEQALPVFEAADDPIALYIGYSALGEVEADGGRSTQLRGIRTLLRPRPAGRLRAVLDPRGAHLVPLLGTTSVSELLAWLDEIEPAAGPDQFVRAYRAWSLAKIGRFDESRAILVEARAAQAERGGGALLANLTAFESVSVELLAGDAAAAAEFGAEGCRMHEELGELGFLAGAAGALAQALYELDRLDEAAGWVDRAGASTPATVGRGRCCDGAARSSLRAGDYPEASRLAREAVALGDSTDMIDSRERPTPTSQRCSCSGESRARRPPPSNKQSSGTSARGTPSLPRARRHDSQRCGPGKSAAAIDAVGRHR